MEDHVLFNSCSAAKFAVYLVDAKIPTAPEVANFCKAVADIDGEFRVSCKRLIFGNLSSNSSLGSGELTAETRRWRRKYPILHKFAIVKPMY